MVWHRINVFAGALAVVIAWASNPISTQAQSSGTGGGAVPMHAQMQEQRPVLDLIQRARELRRLEQGDPFRPRYHFLPPEGRWNDVNGTIFWKGRYHVFYNYYVPNPHYNSTNQDTRPEMPAWGHGSSADLVHWIHHPPAMLPALDGTMPNGIFSGDMIDNAPTPTLIYHVPGQGTCIATSQDDELIHWTPSPRNPVIPIPKEVVDYEVFDPCAWREGDTYYALIGNKNKQRGGDGTSLFRSKDLIHWEYLNPFYRSERRWTDETADCACPDFFPLGDRHMLLFHTHNPINHCQYYLGRWDGRTFVPETHGRMSGPGGQLAAPETLLDGRGRRLFFGWIAEVRDRIDEVGWSGVMTLPRVLSLDQAGDLRVEPARELEALRSNHRRRNGFTLSPGAELELNEMRGDCAEISVVIQPGKARQFGVKVFASPDGSEQTLILYDADARQLRIELERSTLDKSIRYPRIRRRLAPPDASDDLLYTSEQTAPLHLRKNEPLRLRLFLDRSVLEVYANGRQCLTQRVYPSRRDSIGFRVFTRDAGLRVKSVDAWEMIPVNCF